EYEVEIVPISRKKSIISFHVKESKKKPHYVLGNHTMTASLKWVEQETDPPRQHKNGLVHKQKKRAYVRVDDKSLQASREVWEILKRNRNPRDIKFTYGEKEKILMKWLSEHGTITLKEFKKAAGLSYFRASKTLVLLVLANVLEV